jgi:hypothetical protein
LARSLSSAHAEMGRHRNTERRKSLIYVDSCFDCAG